MPGAGHIVSRVLAFVFAARAFGGARRDKGMLSADTPCADMALAGLSCQETKKGNHQYSVLSANVRAVRRATHITILPMQCHAKHAHRVPGQAFISRVTDPRACCEHTQTQNHSRHTTQAGITKCKGVSKLPDHIGLASLSPSAVLYCVVLLCIVTLVVLCASVVYTGGPTKHLSRTLSEPVLSTTTTVHTQPTSLLRPGLAGCGHRLCVCVCARVCAWSRHRAPLAWSEARAHIRACMCVFA